MSQYGLVWRDELLSRLRVYPSLSSILSLRPCNACPVSKWTTALLYSTYIEWHLLYLFIFRGQEHGISQYHFRTHILPMMVALATAISELDWESRLDPMNHSRVWSTIVTACIDTFPIRVKCSEFFGLPLKCLICRFNLKVSCPLSSREQYLFYQHKYSSCGNF